MNRSELVRMFKQSFKGWLAHNAPLNAAALTFFIMLPLPSLLLIVIVILEQFYGKTQAIQQLVQQITSLAGPVVAQLFKQLLDSASSPFTSIWSAIVVIAFSLGGAIGAFAVLRDTMDQIWNVKAAPKQKLTSRIRGKLGPFVIVSVLGFIVIAWTEIANTLFRVAAVYSIKGEFTRITVSAAQIILSFAVATVLFAVTYKTIPQAKVHWRDVGLSAVATGVAFTAVNYILGAYIQTFTVTTIAGAAGSLMIILLWIYILNQIILFGAELSQAYAAAVGEHAEIRLPPRAERIVKPLQRVGRRVEQATKGPVEQKIEAKASGLKQTPPVNETVAAEQVQQATEEAGQTGEEAVEVSFTIKVPPRKRKKKP